MAKSLQDSNHRLVHLDLKGAPPKVEYFEKVFPLFQKWGATGLLIEYEDMFPYWGEIAEVASPYAYSKEDIERIQELAYENKLIVIPLVQTFGHLEFVLKHEKFRTLREVPNYPMALCPTNEDSLTAIKIMIDQVMELHKGIQFFHIGADEVYHLGVCENCKKRMQQENINIQQLFFAHIRSVLSHVKLNFPSITAIMWDDMLRYAEAPVLLESGLGDLVEPMIWHYLTSFMLPPDIWDKFSKVFPNIWFASAFKGATGSSAYVTNIAHHIENHLVWLSVQQEEKLKFQSIRGYAVTGWQRYDHYAVLCELLPQALPSLGICLGILKNGMFSSDVHAAVSKDLKFVSLLPLNPFQSPDLPVCSFPGDDIYKDMLHFLKLEAMYEDVTHSDRHFTWMNEHLMKQNFANPVHIEPLLAQSQRLLAGLQQLRSHLLISLRSVFFDNTVEEWVNVFLEPKIRKISESVELGQSFLQKSVNVTSGSMQI